MTEHLGRVVAMHPSRFLFGRGVFSELRSLIAPTSRIAVVASSSVPLDVESALGRTPVAVERWSGEPDTGQVDAAADRLGDASPDTIVAIGGGSTLDAGKALSAAIPNRPHGVRTFLDVVGPGEDLGMPPIPVIAVPTTAGTGSEMTSNAVLTVADVGQKVSLRDHRLTPVAAVVDPGLAAAAPAPVAAHAALDAAVQLVESYATPRRNAISDMWAWTGARDGLRAAASVVRGIADERAWNAIAFGASCSGAALANSKLGTIHGFAGVVGGRVGLPHGWLCATFAGPVLRATIARLRRHGDPSGALHRYARLAVAAGTPTGSADDLAEWFAELATLVAPHHRPATMDDSEREELARRTMTASSTAGNPTELTIDDLLAILGEVFLA